MKHTASTSLLALAIILQSITVQPFTLSPTWSLSTCHLNQKKKHVFSYRCSQVNAKKKDNSSITNIQTPGAKIIKKPSKRALQKDLNDLVQNMGLQPVVKTNKKQEASEQQSSTSNTKSNHDASLKMQMQLQYARKGHASIRSAIPPSTLSQIKTDLIQHSHQKELEAWQQKVEVALELSSAAVSQSQQYATLQQCREVLRNKSEQGIVEIPFLQHFNTWRSIPSVQSLVTSPVLTSHAKTLLNVPSIKLYQDSLFHKRQNDGPTPWHSDARMAPFDTSAMITFWIPLDYIPPAEKGGTGLYFVNGSHADFALPFWNKNDGAGKEYERLEERYGGEDGVEHYMPMEVGDMSAHAGWTLHSANANGGANGSGGAGAGSGERYALAVTYVDARAEIREDAVSSAVGHGEDRRSYRDWVNDVEPRTYFEHALVPIVQ